MDRMLIENEGPIRLAAFLGVLAAMALWEIASPRRRLVAAKGFRWLNNLGLVAVDTLVLRLCFPILALGTAEVAAARGWGLLNALAVPGWIAIPLSVAALDCLVYWQHRLMHAVPLLWRLHMVHHADPDIDVTTGARFHPIEIALSMAIKMAAIVALGAPAVAVLIFEVLLNATAMFNHANARMPLTLDRVLRLVLVTPDMHRVHHSVLPFETNSNYGFNLPWWDRLFGSYRAQPRAGHAGMTIGLTQFSGQRRQHLWWMLALPFRGATGGYPGATQEPGKN